MKDRFLRKLVERTRKEILRRRKFDLRVVTNKLYRPYPAEIIKSLNRIVENTLSNMSTKERKEYAKLFKTLKRSLKEKVVKDRINVIAYKYEIRRAIEEDK